MEFALVRHYPEESPILHPSPGTAVTFFLPLFGLISSLGTVMDDQPAPVKNFLNWFQNPRLSTPSLPSLSGLLPFSSGGDASAKDSPSSTSSPLPVDEPGMSISHTSVRTSSMSSSSSTPVDPAPRGRVFGAEKGEEPPPAQPVSRGTSLGNLLRGGLTPSSSSSPVREVEKDKAKNRESVMVCSQLRLVVLRTKILMSVLKRCPVVKAQRSWPGGPG